MDFQLSIYQGKNYNYNLFFFCLADDSITFRNGQNTNQQDYTQANNDNDNLQTVENRRNANVRADRGLHESWEWYDNCYRRKRNESK